MNIQPGANVEARVLGFDSGKALLSVGDRIFRAGDAGTFKTGETFSARVLNVERGGITLGVGKGLVLREAGMADLLSARGIPVNPNHLAAAEVLLALGQELTPASLQSLLTSVADDLARFGAGNARGIMLLRQLGLPVTEGGLKLAEFAMSSRHLQALPFVLGGTAAFRSLLSGLSGAAASEADLATAALFLPLGGAMNGRTVKDLLAVLGYRGDGVPALPELLRLLAGMGSDGATATEAQKLADLVDGQRLFAAAADGSFQLILPVEADGRRSAAQLEYRRPKADEHVLNLQLDLATLGPVRTRFHLRKKKLLVTFWTAIEETRMKLATSLPALRGKLRGHNLDVEGIDVFQARPEDLIIPLFPLQPPPPIAGVDTFG